MNSVQRFLLSSIYCNSLSNKCSTHQFFPAYIKEKLQMELDFCLDYLLDLEKKGYISISNFDSKIHHDVNTLEYQLTNLGRSSIKVVLVGGVFDLLHIGHIHTLQSAKSLGDVLIIVVATNSTVSKLNKRRKIYHDESERLELVSSIKVVDYALIGKNDSLYDTVALVKPDIIALGYDQIHDETIMKKNCLDRGLQIEIIRLSTTVPTLKSSIIKKELGSSFYDT